MSNPVRFLPLGTVVYQCTSCKQHNPILFHLKVTSKALHQYHLTLPIMGLTASQYTPLRVLLMISVLSTALFIHNVWRLCSTPEASRSLIQIHKSICLTVVAILSAVTFITAIIGLFDYIKDELIFSIILIIDLLSSAGKQDLYMVATNLQYFLPPIAVISVWLSYGILFCFGIFYKAEDIFIICSLTSNGLYWLLKLGQYGFYFYKHIRRRTEDLHMAPFTRNVRGIPSAIFDLICFIASMSILLLIKSQVNKLLVLYSIFISRHHFYKSPPPL